MVFLKILSILLQTYTLPTVQDDFTVLQHHPYEIRRLENRNPSDLAKRDAAIATLYWDSMGVIKAIFNMDINSEVARIFENSGINLGLAVATECHRSINRGATAYFLRGSAWTGQVGRFWRNSLTRP